MRGLITPLITATKVLQKGVAGARRIHIFVSKAGKGMEHAKNACVTVTLPRASPHCTPNIGNIRAFLIRTGFWGILYHTSDKEPPKTNSICNY